MPPQPDIAERSCWYCPRRAGQVPGPGEVDAPPQFGQYADNRPITTIHSDGVHSRARELAKCGRQLAEIFYLDMREGRSAGWRSSRILEVPFRFRVLRELVSTPSRNGAGFTAGDARSG